MTQKTNYENSTQQKLISTSTNTRFSETLGWKKKKTNKQTSKQIFFKIEDSWERISYSYVLENTEKIPI